MKILLDTHVLLWLHADVSKLSEKAKKILSDPSNEIYFSVINIWETEIKHLAHPKEFSISGNQLKDLSFSANLRSIDLKLQHISLLSSLNYSDEVAKDHKDPFDKILICQAKSENMLLMTHDSLIPFYNEPCILSV